MAVSIYIPTNSARGFPFSTPSPAGDLLVDFADFVCRLFVDFLIMPILTGVR